MPRGAVPVLLSVIDCALLVVPAVVAKLRVLLDRLAIEDKAWPVNAYAAPGVELGMNSGAPTTMVRNGGR
jgi:hypothetical protein